MVHFLVTILFVLILASERAILNVNDVFLILVVLTKKRNSIFFKKVFVFQKTCFKVKVLKAFETFSDCHKKNVPFSQTECYFQNPYSCFLEEPMLFPLALTLRKSVFEC